MIGANSKAQVHALLIYDIVEQAVESVLILFNQEGRSILAMVCQPYRNNGTMERDVWMR